MADWKFHCGILGVAENATLKEVRRAYRKRALILHPDKHGNSLQSKEEFQRLNESYRYLTEALAKGSRPTPKPAATASPAPRARAPHPIAHHGTAAPVQKMLWAYAAAVFLVLLGISVWLDRREAKERPLAVSAKTESGSFAVKSWCQISRPGKEKVIQEISEFWTQEACEAICETMGNERNVACAWGGLEFRALKSTPSTPVASAPAPLQKAEPIPREEKNVQAMPGIFAGSEEFRSTCFMTVVRPGNPFAQAFPNDTEEMCVDRCAQIIVADPLDGIVKCAFAGREVVTHVPDPMASYLARNPSQAGFQQGNSFVANCEIYTTVNGERIRARAGLTSHSECKSLCAREKKKPLPLQEVACLYNGKEF